MPKKLPGYDPRQEMRRSDFEIAHKLDTQLKEVALHHHDFFEVYFLLSGDVTYTIEGRTYHLLPGDMLVINPRELHQVFIQTDQSPYERYVLWITSSLIKKLSTHQTNLRHCFDPERPDYSNHLHLKSEQRNAVQSLMEMLHRENDTGEFGSDMLAYNLISTIMILVNRVVENQGTCHPAADYTNPLIYNVVDYVNLHYGEPLSLDALADRFYVSKYHLSHEFHKHMGTGLYQFIQRKRLLIARQLMKQGHKPAEVYKQCGFDDYAGFYRAFRRVYGQSPREFKSSLQVSMEEGLK